MKLNLITLATVKSQLGIATGTTTYDASITAMIPIVSNDVRRILNSNFDEKYEAVITSGSTSVTISHDETFGLTREVKPAFNLGQVVVSVGSIADDTYVTAFDPETSNYTLSAAASAAGTYLYKSISVGMWPAISKMIYYKIGKMTISAADRESLKAVSYGNVRKDFTDSEINKRFDYPDMFIRELGIPFLRVG